MEAERAPGGGGASGWWQALVVGALGALPHLPGALTNQWAFDDYRFIVRNRHVTEPDSWLRFLYDVTTTDPDSPSGIVRPLRTLEFALDHALFGLDPTAFHLHGLAWHVLACVLLFLLLRALVGSALPAAAGAVIWAVHPMQTESVAWVSSRGDVAMGACLFGALLAALHSRGRDRALVVSLALSGVAMLYKETGVVVPALVVLLRVVRPTPGGRSGDVVRALRDSWPWWVLAGVYLVYRSSVMVGGLDHVTTHEFAGGTPGALATMFCGLGAYLGFAVLPVRPAIDWFLPVRTSLLAPEVLVCLALHVVLFVTAWRARTRRPLVSLAIGAFYVALGPVSNWPVYLGIPTTERFLYVPLLGLAVGVAWGVSRLARPSVPRSLGLAPLAIVALALAAGTVHRTADWYDDTTLWPRTLETVDSPRALEYAGAEELKLGNALRDEARTTEDESRRQALLGQAERHFESALLHSRRAADRWHAIELVEQSTSHVVMRPFTNAASASLQLGRPGHAIRYAEVAIRIGEDLFPQPHYTRAIALLTEGRGAAALHAMSRARELGFDEPEDEFAWIFRRAGTACEERGQFELAARAYDLSYVAAASEEQRQRTRAAAEELRASLAREEVRLAGDPARRRELSVLEAARGNLQVADTLRDALGRGSPEQELAWIEARYVARGTEDGLLAAEGALGRLRPEAESAVRRDLLRARVADELLRYDIALDRYERLLADHAEELGTEVLTGIETAVERLRFDPYRHASR